MIMLTACSGLIFLIGLLSCVYSIPVTTTEAPIDESGGKYANFKESTGPILGKGKYGTVIKMINPTEQRDVVAVKCVELVESDSIQAIHEERDKYLLINKAGRHPNVVRMLAYQAKAGESRFFFQLYDSSLYQKYKDKMQNNPWPFTLRSVFTFCNLLIPLLDALRYIHNINILHRDIHMGNLMISSDDDSRIVLIDFGMSSFDNGQLDRKVANLLQRWYTSVELDTAVADAGGSFDIIHKAKDDIIAAVMTVIHFTIGELPSIELCTPLEKNYRESVLQNDAKARKFYHEAFQNRLKELCEMKKAPAYVEQAIKKLEAFPDQHGIIVQLMRTILNLDREAKADLHESLKDQVQNVKDIDWGSNMKMDFVPETLQQFNSQPSHPKELQKPNRDTKKAQPRSNSQPSHPKEPQKPIKNTKKTRLRSNSHPSRPKPEHS